jgi:hypothetical protein
MRVEGDCREAMTRWELGNKSRNVQLGVVRVVKVIWHLPYTQHSAIPVRVSPFPPSHHCLPYQSLCQAKVRS